ncbi:hypothetical protein Holit_00824 [Hollandina sp. SP2]
MGAAVPNLGVSVSNLGAAVPKIGVAIQNLGAAVQNLGVAIQDVRYGGGRVYLILGNTAVLRQKNPSMD